MDEEPKEGSRRFGRRRFLGLVAGTTALVAAGLGGFVGSSKDRRNAVGEAAAGVPAALKRENPPTKVPEIINPSEDALNACYARFFGGKEHLLPKKAWVRVVEDQNGKRVEGLGNNIGSLAYLYYNREKGQNESFDHFFERFMESLQGVSQKAKLDFISLITSLQVSGENTRDLKEQKVDVTISRVQQVGIPAARVLGMDHRLLEALRPGQEYQDLAKSPIGHYLPKAPIETLDMNAIIRFQSERTIGMMDWESSMRAKALLLFGSDEVKQEFSKKYPDITRSYQDTLLQLGITFAPIIDFTKYEELQKQQKDTVIKSKKDLEQIARDYLDKYKGHLDIFAQDDNALAAIGIKEPLDLWQKYNKTEVWHNLVQHAFQQDEKKNDEKLALEDTKQTLKQDFARHREHYYFQLMSQQILNPKFLPFLLERAKQAGNSYEVQSLQKLLGGVERYQQQAHELRERFLISEKLEGPLEYNSEFQTLATAVTTKMLSEQAGPFDPNNGDSLCWHIFRLVSIREISHPKLVVEDSGFAPDITIDPPYVVDKTLESLGQLESLLMEKKILEKPAWQNMNAFMHAYNAIRDKNFAIFPNLSEEGRKQIEVFFDNRIVNTPHIAMNRSQSVVWNLVSNQQRVA